MGRNLAAPRIGPVLKGREVHESHYRASRKPVSATDGYSADSRFAAHSIISPSAFFSIHLPPTETPSILAELRMSSNGLAESSTRSPRFPGSMVPHSESE